MNELGGACHNFQYEPKALAYDMNTSTQNDVTVQCGDFGYDYY
jgi:hypothetical protein